MFTGRIKRTQYWGAAFFLLLCVIALDLAVIVTLMKLGGGLIANIAAISIAGIASHLLGLGAILIGSLVATFLIAVFAFVASLGLQVRRLHDIGVSGWLIVGIWVVDIAIAAFGASDARYVSWTGTAELILGLGWLVLIFWPGTKGPNEYGDPIVYRSWGHAMLGIKSHAIVTGTSIVYGSKSAGKSNAAGMPGIFPEHYAPPPGARPPLSSQPTAPAVEQTPVQAPPPAAPPAPPAAPAV